MHSDNIQTSKSIQQETGRTFHLATSLLPERSRHPTYVMYASFRVADEVVDQTDGPPPTVQHEQLEVIREAALGNIDPEETDHEAVMAAFRTWLTVTTSPRNDSRRRRRDGDGHRTGPL